MDYQAEYQQKLCTPEEAVKRVKDGDWVDYGETTTFPIKLDAALAERKNELHDVKVRSALSMCPVQVVEQDPNMETFTFHSWHCSSVDRKYITQGKAYFSPMLFRNCGAYYRKGYAKVNVAMMSVSPMDKNGYFGLSLSNICNKEIMDHADIVILEVNPAFPRIRGLAEDCIHISNVDAVVEGTNTVLQVGSPAATETDLQIAKYILPYIHDGATLQLGIGGTPNSVGGLIADSDLKDLGMHTELMSDGYLKLYESGKLTNRRKEINRDKGVFGVCTGSQALYDFMDDNSGILSAPISYINDPKVIGQFNHFISINACIAMDLYGQVCSETAGTRHISGTGGQLDFATGAFDSPNGCSFITTTSTFTDKKGVRHSRILPIFTAGDVITTPRSQTHYLVTEYGVAEIAGKTTWERAEAIVGLAHPDFREELIAAAEEQGIWRKSNKR